MSDPSAAAPAPALPETIMAEQFAGWIVLDESPTRLTLSHSDGRKIGVRILDMADMLDLMEAAGQVSTNQGWMNLAIPAVSVDYLDEKPVPIPATKEKIKQRTRELGNERMGAIIWALFQRKTPEAELETAKN